MTIPRLKSIEAYQTQYPPLHQMVAAYLGVLGENPNPTTTTTKEKEEANDDLLDFFNKNEIKQGKWVEPRKNS